MCLNTSNLQMSYNKAEDCFTGIGYKQLDFDIPVRVRKKGGDAILAWLTNKYGGNKHLEGGWMEAKGVNYSSQGKTKTSRECSNDNKRYWPGFHIWLNQDDAEMYYANGEMVVKVEYAEVTDFGDNETNNDEGEGPCVIARYMRFVEVVQYPEDFFED